MTDEEEYFFLKRIDDPSSLLRTIIIANRKSGYGMLDRREKGLPVRKDYSAELVVEMLLEAQICEDILKERGDPIE